MSRKPRSEIFFPVVQTPSDVDYVPLPKRDPRQIAEFEGGPRGIVIARQQKLGAAVAATTFERVVTADDDEQLAEVADLFSQLAIGTAYHTFAQREADRVMYRRVKIPMMIDPETGKRTSEQQLIESAQAGLAHTAQLAIMIDEQVGERSDVRGINQQFGYALATTGMTLAAIKADIAGLRLNAEDMQWHSWQAAQGAYLRTFELSGKIGVRPTLAQLPDEGSPLRRYLNDDSDSVSQPTYEVLLDEIEKQA